MIRDYFQMFENYFWPLILSRLPSRILKSVNMNRKTLYTEEGILSTPCDFLNESSDMDMWCDSGNGKFRMPYIPSIPTKSVSFPSSATL